MAVGIIKLTGFSLTGVVTPPYITYAKDTFTRADTTDGMGNTEIGNFPWLKNPSSDPSGLWRIVSGMAVKSSLVQGSVPKEVLIHDGHSDGTVQVTFVDAASATSGLVFRVASNGSSGFLASCSTATFTIKHRIGSTYTTLYTATRSGSAGDVIAIVLNGSSITLKVNGSIVGSLTSILDLNSDGFGLWAGASGTLHYDDFEHNSLLS